MTIRELISKLRVILKENSADTVLSNRDIWSIAWSYAITLIQRETDTKRNIFYLNMFKNMTLNMKEVSIIDGVEGFDIPLDCIMYRSIKKLPPIVESKFGYITRQITTIDRSKSFDLVTPQSFRDKIKITKGKGKFVYVDNGYLYSNQKYPLTISALFSNIMDMLGKNCKVMDLEAPIPGYIESSILQMTAQQLGLFKQAPQDVVVNDNPNQ